MAKANSGGKGRQPSRSSAASSARKTKPRKELRTDSGLSEKTLKEIHCIIFIFVCFMLAMSYYTPFFGIVGSVIRNIGLFLLGNTAFALPVLAAAAGVHMLLKNTLHPHVHRYVAALLLCVCISGLLAVRLYNQNPTFFGDGYTQTEIAKAKELYPEMSAQQNLTLGQVLSNMVISAREGKGGGILGYLAAIIFIRLISPVGTTLLFWALILVFAVVITGTTPFIKLAECLDNWIEERKNAAPDEDGPERESQISLADFAEPPPVDYGPTPVPRRRMAASVPEQEKPDLLTRLRLKLAAGKSRNKKKKKAAVPAEKPVKEKSANKKSSSSTRKLKPQVVKPELNDGNTGGDAVADDIKISLFDARPDSDVPPEVAEMAKAESGAVEAPVKTEKPKAEPAIPVTDDEIDDSFIPYRFPPVSLLGRDKPTKDNTSEEDVRKMGQKLIDTLRSFGVEAKITEIIKGPSITRFEIAPAAGVKVNKIVNLSNDIALNLAAVSVRVIAPIPGKAAVGIELPNKKASTVRMRDIIDTEEFRSFKSKTAFALGKDISGKVRIADISKMPHMLIAGATGSGKSVCLNTLIISIIYKADPNEVKLIMIDPKRVEFQGYNGIPHLLIPVVTDPRRAAGALNWAVQEMIKRYKLFADNNVRNLQSYNELAAVNGERKLEQIIIIVDELADLMMVCAKEVEDSICRLAQMARAAGMYLVIATQRPSVDVITGLIKANIPSRLALVVSNQIDSRTILDMAGAEKLLGKGDMLFLPVGANTPIRIQGAYLTDPEINAIVEYIKQDFNAKYDEDIIEHIERGADDGGREEDSGEADEMLPAAIQAVVEAGQASASLLQRRLKVGYARAGRLIDQLEERGIIGPTRAASPGPC